MAHASQFPLLITWSDKHGDITYVANSMEDVARAYFDIIKHWAQGQYVWEPDMNNGFSKKMKEAVALSQEQVDALPESFKEDVERLRRKAAEAQREIDKESKNYKRFMEIASHETFASFLSTFPSLTDAAKRLKSVLYTYEGGEYMEVEVSIPATLPE